MSTTFGASAELPGRGLTVNFANVNAEALFGLLGLEWEQGGEWSVEDLPEIRRRLMRALNDRKGRAHLVSDPLEFGGPGTGMVRQVWFGSSDDQTVRRLAGLLAVVVEAHEEGLGVSWW